MRIILTEEEKKQITDMHGLQSEFLNISEQLELLSINPASIFFSSEPGNEKTILLKGKVNNQVQTLKYKISGRYSKVGNFDMKLRNIKRYPDGSLYAEAKPEGFLIKAAFSMIPDKNKTKDGFLICKIPLQKISAALKQLRDNKGSTASIDAGYGVYIDLKRSA